MSSSELIVFGFLWEKDQYGNVWYHARGVVDVQGLAKHIASGVELVKFPHAVFIVLDEPTSRNFYGDVDALDDFAFFEVRPTDGAPIFKSVHTDIVPPAPHAMTGVTAIVECDGHVALVRELYGPPVLKAVTGSLPVDVAPHDHAACEVKEELGISTWNATKLVAVVYQKTFRPGKDDVNVVFRGELPAPQDGTLPGLSVQTAEIAEAEWVPLEEVATRADVSAFTKLLLCGELPTGVTREKRGRADVDVYWAQ